MTDSIRLAHISRYPVKGLDEQSLEAADLSVGAALPGDRRFAIAHGASAYDAAQPGWQKKAHFLNWARTPAIAAIRARYAGNGHVVSLSENGAELLRDADLTTEAGRAALCDVLLKRLPQESRGKLTVAEAPGVSFSDVEPKFLSIQNRASLDAIGSFAGMAFDQRRMRGNLLLDGVAPWAEMDWVGKSIRVGEAELEIVEIIGRCPATTLDPLNGARNLPTLDILNREYGHQDCGLYAKVVAGGTIRVGDAVSLR
jgi:uncharacterized protein YcbX